MRITGGEARGRVLRVPRLPGVRPTSDRVREAIFNVLVGVVPGAQVLDLFAGSGALGLEALSRGAAFVTFVERDRRAAAVLAENVHALGYGDRARIVREDVFRAVQNTIGRTGADLVFADPPYDQGQAERVLAAVAPLLGAGAWLVLEHSVRELPPDRVPGVDRVALVDRRRYGDTVISYYRCTGEEAPPT